MANNITPKLKAYVRIDGTGRVIPGGPIFQASKPKVGNWEEIPLYYQGTSTTTTTSTTATPTTTTTTTVAPTTTTTTTAGTPFSADGVGYNQSSGAAACGSPTFNNVTGNGTTFCNSTVFTSSDFNNVQGGPSVYIAYGGYYFNVNMSGITATVIGSCQPC